MLKLLPLLILAACGTKKIEPQHPTQPTDNLRQELQAEIARITPNLKWCRGLAVNEFCNYGDAIYRSGQLFMLGAFEDKKAEAFQAVADSIDEDGRPWRGPLKNETPNSFSSDQTYGLVFFSISGMSKSVLEKVYSYALIHSKNLCPDATDLRCVMKPSLEVIIRDELGLPVDSATRALSNAQILTDAHTATPNYRAALILQQLMIKIKHNRVTETHRKVLDILRTKIPNNLYFRTIDTMINGGDFKPVLADILACMKMNTGGGIHALFEQGNNACREGIYGQEVIALSQFLTGKGF